MVCTDATPPYTEPMTNMNGRASMRSTAFHWMASLEVLNRRVLEALYVA
jgi:hypothetical protein